MEIGKVSGAPASGAIISGVSDWGALAGYYDTPFMEFTFDTTLGNGLPQLEIYMSGLAGSPPWPQFVDWGDGTLEEVSGSPWSHTYSTGGTYDVKFSGFALLALSSSNDSEKLIDIKQFVNTVEVSSLNAGSELQSISSLPAPVLASNAGILLLANCPKLSSVPSINSWDVSVLSTLGSCFFASSVFDLSLSNWDVSNVTNFFSTFQEATSFNQDISSWDVSNANMLGSMFYLASSFDQNLGAWTFKNSANINFIFALSGMSDINVALCLEGWDSVGQGTNVIATLMFGSAVIGAGPRTLSESTYPNAKTAYDNLIANNSWDFTDSFNWVA